MFHRSVISIIDDDPSLREALLDLMSSLGFTAEAFAGAQAFLESGALERASCLVADVQMPGLSGLELHSRLLARGRKSHNSDHCLSQRDGARASVESWHHSLSCQAVQR